MNCNVHKVEIYGDLKLKYFNIKIKLWKHVYNTKQNSKVIVPSSLWSKMLREGDLVKLYLQQLYFSVAIQDFQDNLN